MAKHKNYQEAHKRIVTPTQTRTVQIKLIHFLSLKFKFNIFWKKTRLAYIGCVQAISAGLRGGGSKRCKCSGPPV